MSEERTERKLNIASLVLGILGFLALLLMNYATSEANQKQMETNAVEMKAGVSALHKEFSDFKITAQKHEFILTALTSEQGKLSGQIESNQADDARQWDYIRDTKAKADSAVSRELFIEWKSDLERRNPNVTSPPLKAQ